MNGLEIIGIFSVITVVTLLIWCMLFFISKRDGDDEINSFICASIITIVMLIIMLSIVASEYIGSVRKIDEYKEKLSKYEKLEMEDGSGN